jgi:hypothetical protein
MRKRRRLGSEATTFKACLIGATLFGSLILAVTPHAQEGTLHDPALPTVPSEALHQLSDTRTRQRIMAARQSHFQGRCVCRYQTTDSKGESCKGRHEIVKTKLQPLCSPGQVSPEMVNEWNRLHP